MAVEIKSDSRVTSWETESSALNKRCELDAHMMQPTCHFYRGGCHPVPYSLTPGTNPSIEGTEMKLRRPSYDGLHIWGPASHASQILTSLMLSIWERDLIFSLPYHGGNSGSPVLFPLWALKTELDLQMWANQRAAQLDAASCEVAVEAALSDFRFGVKLF